MFALAATRYRRGPLETTRTGLPSLRQRWPARRLDAWRVTRSAATPLLCFFWQQIDGCCSFNDCLAAHVAGTDHIRALGARRRLPVLGEAGADPHGLGDPTH